MLEPREEGLLSAAPLRTQRLALQIAASSTLVPLLSSTAIGSQSLFPAPNRRLGKNGHW